MSIRYLIKNLDRKEWAWIIIATIFIIAITSVIHLYGFLNTPEGLTYFGRQSLNAHDTPVYFSYLEQAREGNFLFRNLYTTGPQIRTLNIFWLAAGLLGRLFSLPPAWTFQIVRIILTPILIFTLYLLTSYFFEDTKKRKVSFILLLFSSGFGALTSKWLVPLFQTKYGYTNWPMDLWVPESNTFFTLYHTPHIIASLILLLFIFLLALLSFETNKKIYSIGAGLLALLLFQFHPFHIPTIFGIIGVYILILSIKYKKIRWDLLTHAAIIFFISLPSIIYYFWLMRYDWTFWQKTVQNVCLTPSLLMVVISYGLLIIFAFVGLISLWKNKLYDDKYLFLVVWPLTQFLLIYLPVDFQRRLTEGLHVGLSLLACLGLFYAYDFIKKRIKSKLFYQIFNNKWLVVFLFLFFFSLSNFSILGRDLLYLCGLSDELYLSNKKTEAAQWFAQNTDKNAQIIASPTNGNFIPALSGRTVYAGHGIETIFYTSKIGEIDWLFRDNGNDDRKKIFLKTANLNYIFYGLEEKNMGSFNPDEKDYLKKVYQNSEVAIYEVVDK